MAINFENKFPQLSLSIILIIFVLLWLGTATTETIAMPDYANAATSSAVTVSATVGAVISCSSNIASTDFGTLTDSAIATSTPNASTTISCANSASGCTLSVNDAGSGSNPGLWSSPNLIESPNGAYAATAVLSAGTEGYGIQATTTAVGSGGTLGIASRYLQTGNTVGGLATTTITLASSTSASTNREVIVTHKAAIATATPGGSYSDTITYSCTAN